MLGTLFIVVGIINILAKSNNYNIPRDNPNLREIRVRRGLEYTPDSNFQNNNKNIKTLLKSFTKNISKRDAYYNYNNGQNTNGVTTSNGYYQSGYNVATTFKPLNSNNAASAYSNSNNQNNNFDSNGYNNQAYNYGTSYGANNLPRYYYNQSNNSGYNFPYYQYIPLSENKPYSINNASNLNFHYMYNYNKSYTQTQDNGKNMNNFNYQQFKSNYNNYTIPTNQYNNYSTNNFYDYYSKPNNQSQSNYNSYNEYMQRYLNKNISSTQNYTSRYNTNQHLSYNSSYANLNYLNQNLPHGGFNNVYRNNTNLYNYQIPRQLNTSYSYNIASNNYPNNNYDSFKPQLASYSDSYYSNNYNQYNVSGYNANNNSAATTVKPIYNVITTKKPNNYTVETTTPLIIAKSCIICNVGCPAFFKKIGFLCVPEEDDY